jgi:hypothetical protein
VYDKPVRVVCPPAPQLKIPVAPEALLKDREKAAGR